jgi:anti-sigma factor RsiW
MAREFTPAELETYIDEELPAEEMAAIESEVRVNPGLRERIAELLERLNQGSHSIASIWRRHRLSCLSRGQLGNYLLGTLPVEESGYIEFHVRTVGCALCAANLADLQRLQADGQRADAANGAGDGALDPAVRARRQRYLESNTGYLAQRKRD